MRSISMFYMRKKFKWKDPDFYRLVENIWLKPCKASSALDKIQQKLKMFKQYFKGWGFNLQGELSKKRKMLHEELSMLEDLKRIHAYLVSKSSENI